MFFNPVFNCLFPAREFRIESRRPPSTTSPPDEPQLKADQDTQSSNNNTEVLPEGNSLRRTFDGNPSEPHFQLDRDTQRPNNNSGTSPEETPLRKPFDEHPPEQPKMSIPADPENVDETASDTCSLFNEDSDRGLVPARVKKAREGHWTEVVGKSFKPRRREHRTLEGICFYRELDIARNYLFVIPRGLTGASIIQGKMNCPEALPVMYEKANEYLRESWTGRQRRMIIKFRMAKEKACFPFLPTPEVNRSSKDRIEQLSASESMAYSLGVSTIGVRDEWQIFKEDMKPKLGCFDIMPYRLKYFGDLDMDMKNGMYVDIGYCECGWTTNEQGRTLDLTSTGGGGDNLGITCKELGSSMVPTCPNCQMLYQLQKIVRRM